MDILATLPTWLYDNLPLAVAILDVELRYRYVNAAYAATQGLSVKQQVGRSLLENASPWSEQVLRMTEEARESGRPVDAFNVMLTYPRQPSLHRLWDATVLPIKTDETLEGFAVYLIDVSDRQEVTRLASSETRLRSVLDTAIDAILVIDEHGVILEANPAASHIFGYRADEMIGQNVTVLMPSPFREEHDRFLERYLATSMPHIIGTIREVQGRRKDGTLFSLELSVAESRESAPARHFVGILRDITERKRLEAELETARARLEAIFDTVPVPLYVINTNGGIELYNEAARMLFGESLTQEGLLAMTRLHPDTRQPWPMEEWPIVRALREGRTINNIEQLLVLANGHETIVLAQAAPIIVDGKIVAAIGVSQDISALKAADQAKDAFLALVTHELRSPLATIISWTDIALEDPSLHEEALRVVHRNANALRRIVDDLLDFSRVLYGKVTLRQEPIDAWEIARHTAIGLAGQAEERHLKLSLQTPPEPLPVLADPIRLQQIISNLLLNAMKFTPAGGQITLEGAREDDQARLRVTDTGIGIPPERLPFLFKRFEQLGREYVSGGLGLGLAIVKGLTELHGGRVAAESTGEGHGSTFTVWLPLREERSDAPPPGQ